MMNFTESTKQLIDKLYQGRKHVELTIGILRGGWRRIFQSAGIPVRPALSAPGSA